jgi:RND family efflux transporter MFP subunit
MRLRSATLLTLLGLGPGLALAGCSGHATPEKAESAPSAPRTVRTALVERSGSQGEIAVPGVVAARRRASLSARIPASVVALPYREGQWVEENAVVVRLDDAAVRAAVAAAEADLAAAEADLARAKALLEKGAATPRELEQMSAAASGARARLTAARDQLSYTVLRAPFAGRVASRRASLGEVAGAGVPLIEIEGEGGLELQATVDPEVAARLVPGAKVKALVDGQASAIPATVTAVAPSGDPMTHRFQAKADLPAMAGLRAGLFGRLVVPGMASEARLLVPPSALIERGGLTGLFVVDDGRARLRWVARGALEGDRVEIRAGVEAGERIVLDPAGLVDGAAVQEGS